MRGSVQVSHTWITEIQKATKVDEGIISEVTLRQLSELKKAIWRLKGIAEYPERWENIDSDQDIWSHHAKHQEQEKSLKQGSPTPGPQTATCPWSVRNWATQQEMRETKAIPTLPSPGKNCLPWHQSLVPKKVGDRFPTGFRTCCFQKFGNQDGMRALKNIMGH